MSKYHYCLTIVVGAVIVWLCNFQVTSLQSGSAHVLNHFGLLVKKVVSYVFRTINELEAQLDYERLRRERLEAQLDQHRRDMADLSYRLQSRMGDDSGVRFKKEK